MMMSQPINIAFQANMLIILAIAGLLGVKIHCDRSTTYVKAQNVSYPDYLQLFEISHESSTTHAIELVDPYGSKWFRRSLPILDLSMINTSSAAVAQCHSGGGYGVTIRILPQHVRSIEDWSNTHIGQHVGVVVQGQLVDVETIHGALSSMLLILCTTRENASQLADAIRSGGLPANQMSIECSTRPTTIPSNGTR